MPTDDEPGNRLDELLTYMANDPDAAHDPAAAAGAEWAGRMLTEGEFYSGTFHDGRWVWKKRR